MRQNAGGEKEEEEEEEEREREIPSKFSHVQCIMRKGRQRIKGLQMRLGLYIYTFRALDTRNQRARAQQGRERLSSPTWVTHR